MKTLDSILDKIQKLKSLSQSANVHEASLAAGRVAELMQRYKIEEADIEAKEDRENNREKEKVSEYDLMGNDDKEIKFERKKSHWKMLIASGCAAACHCSTFWREANIRFIGRKSDVDSARYLYGLISPQVERLAQIAYNEKFVISVFLDGFDPIDQDSTITNRKSWTHAFKIGCARTIKNRMVAEVRRAHKDLVIYNPNSQALMVINNKLDKVREFESLLGLKKGPKVKVRYNEAYFEGREKGKDINLGSKAKGALGEGKRQMK